MQKRKLLKRGKFNFLFIALSLIYLTFSCSTGPETKETAGITEKSASRIESIRIAPGTSDNDTVIEIINSKPATYTSLTLSQPLRFIVDIDAITPEKFTEPAGLANKIIKTLHLEKIKDRPLSTRLVALLSQDVEYNITEQDRVIKIFLSPKKISEKLLESAPAMPVKEEKIGASKPRLFFSPGKKGLNKILGVDFFMLSERRSRIVITAAKKAEYILSRRDISTLILEIKDITIPAELTRYLDSSQFKGVVNRIVPVVRTAERKVDLIIKVREMVPFYLMQTDNEIRIDFNETSIKPPPKKITAVKLREKSLKLAGSPTVVSTVATPSSREMVNKGAQATQPSIAKIYTPKKKYTGARMTLDFADADIRNILKLIGEISKLNIVWGPEVKGTVSMRLKNVPWDQALDLVLRTNNLGKRREGNIIWITTKDKIDKIEKEDEEKLKAEQDRVKELKEEQKKAKMEEPLVTAYIPVNFADAKEIEKKIDLTKRGKISSDERTNIIFVKDTVSSIEAAKKMVRLLDTSVKQILIEARIVDATSNFSRDLGLRWSSIDRKWQRRKSMAWESEPTKFSTSDDSYFGGNFSSNAPGGWSPNLGLSFASLTNKGLGTIALDASLALAETEGDAKIISAPKIITSDGSEAQISQGDVLIIPATEQVESKELKATLSLTVTPKVSANNYITMDVDVTDDRAPSISLKLEKHIKTKLIVKTGDTVVIGGIYKEENSKDESGIPWLRNIPFLGWLFKAESKIRKRSELLIFLTPTILKGG